MTPAELSARLAALGPNVRKRLEYAMDLAGAAVVATSKEYCSLGNTHFYRPPHQTGALSRSLTHKVSSESSRVACTVGSNIQDPPYPLYVHEGTSVMPARPFLLDSIEENRERITNFLKEAAFDGVKESCQ